MGFKRPVTFDDIFPDTVQAEMERAGLTPGLLAKYLMQELEAKESRIVKIKGRMDKSKEKKYDLVAEGPEESVISVQVPDMPTRQRARMDAHRLRGDYPAEKVESKNTHEIYGQAPDIAGILGKAERKARAKK